LYYATKLKPIITVNWEAKYKVDHPEHDPSKPIPAPSLAFRNEQTRLMYQAETDDVKKEVEAKIKQSEDGEPDAAVLPDEDGAEMSPELRERVSKLKAYQR
jgi:hypothetical protein